MGNCELPTRGVSGHVDPVGEAPWAMQFVVRVEKQNSPTHRAVCEATAMACVSLLNSAESDHQEWGAAVVRWQRGRIRKLVRRARGAAWANVQDVAGVTVAHRGVEVRAFVPCATDSIPRDLAKLQVSGLDLSKEDLLPCVDLPDTVIASVTPDPELSTGKAAAAAAHAAQLCWLDMAVNDRGRMREWEATGWEVVVEQPDAKRWAELKSIARVVVVDAGFTEIAPGTTTSMARW